MQFKSISKIITISIISIILILILVSLVMNFLSKGGRDCNTDSDCVPYGKGGTCNCGCYNKDKLPLINTGKCWCAAPKACACVDNKCTGSSE